MRKILKWSVDVPSQAAAIFLLEGLWYLAVLLGFLSAGKGFVSNLHLGWVAVFTFVPFITPILAVVLVVSYFRDGRRCGDLVFLAVGAAISPWVLLLIFVVLAKIGGR